MNVFFSRSPRQWLVGILLISLLLPISLASLLVGIGNASSCPMVGKTTPMCLVNGTNIGQSVQKLVDWTWYFPVMSVFQTPLLSIALFIGILTLIYKSFQGWPRVIIGVLSIWYIWFAPIITGMTFVFYLANQAQCSLNEGGVGDCYLFGFNVSSTFHTAATIPWLLIILFPLCGFVSMIYAAIGLANLKNNN